LRIVYSQTVVAYLAQKARVGKAFAEFFDLPSSVITYVVDRVRGGTDFLRSRLTTPRSWFSSADKYVVLGYLSWRPLTGYDVKKMIADSETLPWTASNNQIYHALVDLHKDGWVTKNIEYQVGAPDCHVYTITEAGKQALRQWIMSEPEPPQIKKPFLNQLMWADSLDAQELDERLEAYLNCPGGLCQGTQCGASVAADNTLRIRLHRTCGRCRCPLPIRWSLLCNHRPPKPRRFRRSSKWSGWCCRVRLSG
jgi:DNA-binding PadR family transcriptional regulator